VILDDAPERLGPLTQPTHAAVAELTERNAVSRVWSADHTLWRDDPTEIADRLGWLTVVPDMVTALDGLRTACERAVGDAEHVLLMGMGGSSLFPEVLAQAGQPRTGAPRLHVLDTTDPAAIARLGAELPPERTLHVAASKSGSTLETRSHLAWAWERHPDPARFAVITDPGSELGALARERSFRAVWENRPDIGGRYSALSLFGVVPGLLAGVDVGALLATASETAERLRAAPTANPGARLAAIMAAGVRSGRDKLTLVVPERFAAFGLWVEQLIAESTGKDGTGILPVVGEPVGDPDVYGDDRVFVALGEAPGLDALAAAGHPVTVLPFDGTFPELGGQVLLWEFATALAGALLGIQPFDQPDVAAAKAATQKVLAEGPPELPDTSLKQLLDLVQPGDYVAIQAFLDPGSTAASAIERARVALRDRLRVATTVGFGPRFLHSTGQLHKGGAPNGVFVQVVADAADADVPIPGQPYGFATLERAQADGDLVTLADRRRRAGRVPLADLLDLAP
jgi:transaldolase/glucose-6-phosphate isomerase